MPRAERPARLVRMEQHRRSLQARRGGPNRAALRPFSHLRSPPPRAFRSPSPLLSSTLILATTVGAGALFLSRSHELQAEPAQGGSGGRRAVLEDSQDPKKGEVDVTTTDWRQHSQLHTGEQSKHVFLWGSNKCAPISGCYRGRADAEETGTTSRHPKLIRKSSRNPNRPLSSKAPSCATSPCTRLTPVRSVDLSST